MTRQEHDWTMLKAEYLQSDVKDAAVFIRQKLGIPQGQRLPGVVTRNLKGWAIDWEENRRKIAEAATEKARRELSNEMAEGLVAIQRLVSKIAKEAADEKRFLTVKDLGRVWEILMTENGRPTKIARNIVSMPEDPADSFNRLRLNDRRPTPESPEEVQDNTAA